MSEKKMGIKHVFLDRSVRESLKNVSVPACQVDEILKILKKEETEKLEKLDHM